MPEEYKIIDKKIGIAGATVLTIGNAIAITMFLLPAHLLEDGAGPSIALAAGVTAIPIIFSILLSLQLGSAIPTAGGGYVYVSRLMGPFWGFIVPWVAVPAIWIGLIFVGYGFAEYVRFFLPITVDLVAFEFTVPRLSIETWIWILLIPFLVLNLFGIRLVTQIQFILVGIIILGMLSFIVPGTLHIDPGNYQPMFPEGYGPFAVAVVSLFIAMYGFGLALNIGEEIKNPVKNIPRIIAISTVIGVTLMVATVVVAVGTVHWTEWAGAEAGISVVAGEFLPSWVASLVAVAAVVGALTTINTIYVSFSRLVMRASRDWIFPPTFAKVSEKYDSPNRAVLLIGVPPIFIVPFAPDPVIMSLVLSLGLLISIVFLAFAAYRLPKVFPQRYEHSFYKLSPRVLLISVAGGIVVPLLFWLLLLVQEPIVGFAFLFWMALGYPFYRLRIRRYQKQDIDLKERMKSLHAHEQEKAAGE